ncbi:MAG: response regulator transcription factor [bacterium]|nr:response regulator transcription factor [bacterium]
MSDTKILIVEDDPNLGQILNEYLGLKGFKTHLSTDGEAGLHAYKAGDYDLCILDLMMPKMDGFSLAKEIRKDNEDVPIVFLTAKSMKEDVIEGFKVGADDYLTKPFSMEELLLRLGAILKRSRKSVVQDEFPELYELGDYKYNYHHHLLTSSTSEVKLTGKENELLRMFCENFNQTVERGAALKRIWGDDSYFNARSMDVYIAKLRKHLKEDEKIQIITVHGQGFKLVKLN